VANSVPYGHAAFQFVFAVLTEVKGIVADREKSLFIGLDGPNMMRGLSATEHSLPSRALEHGSTDRQNTTQSVFQNESCLPVLGAKVIWV
jgi:hypothetical protein